MHPRDLEDKLEDLLAPAEKHPRDDAEGEAEQKHARAGHAQLVLLSLSAVAGTEMMVPR